MESRYRQALVEIRDRAITIAEAIQIARDALEEAVREPEPSQAPYPGEPDEDY